MSANLVEDITTLSNQMEEAIRNGQGNIFCQLADERLKKIKELTSNNVDNGTDVKSFVKELIHKQYVWLEFAESWLTKQRHKIEKLKQQQNDTKRLNGAYNFRNSINGKYIVRHG